MNVLVIESSTSSAKAMIYDTVKNDFTVENAFYPPMGNDLTQHDPMVVYEASLAAAKTPVSYTHLTLPTSDLV